MKISEILLSNIKPLWDEAAEKDFVIKMAEGTLDIKSYKKYMIQDYLYLFDYIDILKDIKALSDNDDISAFLEATIREVEEELKRVHIPSMKNLGINVEEISKSDQNEVFAGYLSFMKSSVAKYGINAGLIGLLQCSWCYAYIAKKVCEKHSKEIGNSSYKNWFEAYTCKAYIDANQTWIDVVDRECMNIDKSDTDIMVEIFKECAVYENKIWDSLL